LGLRIHRHGGGHQDRNNQLHVHPAICDDVFTGTGGVLPKFFFQPPLPRTKKYKPKKISPSRSSIVA
jgi:hypothetical protein